VPFVASPSSRRAFDLRSGACLDDGSVSVPAYAVKVVDGVVHVGPRRHP
jgi:nitrite reductase (NADH) small subunit